MDGHAQRLGYGGRHPSAAAARRFTLILVTVLSVVSSAHAVDWTKEPLAPLPEAPELDADKVELGHRLFFDVKLSKSGTLSCASCHLMTSDGAGVSPSHLPKDVAIDGHPAPMNSPSIFNAAYNFKQRWRADGGTLREVITKPLTNLMNYPPPFPSPPWPAPGRSAADQMRAEHDTWRDVAERLRADAAYRQAFATLYGDVTRAGIEDALATYMIALAPRGSAFDKYLQNRSDIGPEAEDGYRLFKSYGCVSCHQGRGVGGNMVAEFGVMLNDDEANHEPLIPKDKDGLRVRPRFKVPSLRNVARTAPYFHDGSVDMLDNAIRIMGRVQLGRTIPDADVAKIQAFLTTLNAAPAASLLADPIEEAK
jgi:cytochrome c peroxidase